jgi:hypothetical protein
MMCLKLFNAKVILPYTGCYKRIYNVEGREKDSFCQEGMSPPQGKGRKERDDSDRSNHDGQIGVQLSRRSAIVHGEEV